eukprot:2400549-Amphidinium_carterae.1
MQVSAVFAKHVHGQMVDIYLLRIAARERDAEATGRDATSRMSDAGSRWTTATRITRKRPREEIPTWDDTGLQRD